jgi:hypothetical protein
VPNFNPYGSLAWRLHEAQVAAHLKSLDERKYPWLAKTGSSASEIVRTLRARPAAPASPRSTRKPPQRKFVTFSATDVRNLQTRVRQAQWALLLSGDEANRALSGKLSQWGDYLERRLSE